MPQKTSTRERIVQKATMLFWRDGYHLVSTDAICRAAGVRRSSLYHAFPSKADIVAASLDWVWERNWREIRDAYAGDEAIEIKFRRHVEWFGQSQLRLQAESGALLGTFDMALGVALPGEVVEQMRAHQAEHGRLVEATISQIIRLRGGDEADSGRVAQIVNSLIVASNYRARLLNDDAPLRELPSLVQDVLEAFSKSAGLKKGVRLGSGRALSDGITGRLQPGG